MIPTLIIMSVLLIAQGYFFMRQYESWQQERKDLYNRIQASSYVEYKAMEQPKKEKKEEAPPIEYV